jgi:hypothetical protein
MYVNPLFISYTFLTAKVAGPDYICPFFFKIKEVAVSFSQSRRSLQ